MHILKIPPQVACVATLPCETLMSAKQAPSSGQKKLKNFFDLPNKADTVLPPAQNLQVITIHSYIYVLWASCARG